jgi:plastocyanin
MRLGGYSTLVALATSLALLTTAAHSLADEGPEQIVVTIENHRFRPDEIRVKAGTPFTLVVTNKDAKPEEIESKDLRVEKVIPAGRTASIRVRALKPGTYPFFGEFNPTTARGRIVAE